MQPSVTTKEDSEMDRTSAEIEKKRWERKVKQTAQGDEEIESKVQGKN